MFCHKFAEVRYTLNGCIEKDVTDIHHGKTSIYTYENPLHIGAILAGASTNDLELLSKYAIPGGIAFQIQDDILGLFGNTEKTGKPAHSDLRQGKMTLLIIKALEKANPNQKSKLLKLWVNMILQILKLKLQERL